ncbi:uncharacterized protein LOC101747207 isoform X2 [Bombyx mori]|uniref:Protein-tyrosine-phosphatase n=1 Tax=Bombyx mori TaxID=7091 RepID=A0A8R2R9I6_BOMMO|nr:uncharacterized protein LOC101747207 isoform X2 [Bombyx mori]
MYFHYSVGAIFGIFILCVHCDNAGDNEIKEIYVPSAPQNLTADNVTSKEIHLLWTPPSTFTVHPVPIREDTTESDPVSPQKVRSQNDGPTNDVINPAPESVASERLKELEYPYDMYRNDKNDDYSNSGILMDSYKTKRDLWSHRHRKRSHDNVTESKAPQLEQYEYFEVNLQNDEPIEVVKKTVHPKPHKDMTQIAYILYYEVGVQNYDFNASGVQKSADVRKNNVFLSDLMMEDSTKHTRNLTLWNKSGIAAKVVAFNLKHLKPFTAYKIWVRAFYNTSPYLTVPDLSTHLSPRSKPLYVMTDVEPPSEPIILKLSCDMDKGSLYIQWRQPLYFNNTLNQYVVTLRKIPEHHPRKTVTFPTSKDDLETFFSVPVELWNNTRYEVILYAVTFSIAKEGSLVMGKPSAAQEVSSESCVERGGEQGAVGAAGAGAEVGDAPQGDAKTKALLAILPLALLAAVGLALVYCRCRSRLSKCISAAYNYLEEGGERGARAPLNSYKKPGIGMAPGSGGCAAADGGPAGGRGGPPPRIAGTHHPALSATAFPRHVAALHADGDIGFSKEYEIVVSRSNALGHTSHHSHRPENRLKNRYLNITAYDHSRVCVSEGGRCGAAGCAGGGGAGAPCDYVNANFIDGVLPQLGADHLARIKAKLRKRDKPDRPPSIKQSKPPPLLAEGIESAFLNIEFSGIVESEDREDYDSDRSDDSELDDVYVDIDGVRTRIKLEWALWKRRYIATQGPTPATLDAFWRMIWQHRVHTLVMITNLVERGRRKCDMYWPAGGRGSAAQFGPVRVTLLHEDVRAAYTVRHMSVRVPDSEPSTPGGGGAERAVVQYHYTVWPDHGTPRHPLAVLPFVRAASAHPSTVLVHCSAGVGRTGTYIVLDAQLNQLKLTGTLSPLGFLCRARTQRNHLVQTEEQYVFVHDALLEHVRSGNTEVEFSNTRQYLLKLLEDITEEELAVLDLNPGKNKVENESPPTNVIDETNNDTGSQESVRTVDLDSEPKSSSESEEKEIVNGDEKEGERETREGEGEGVYDLAPRTGVTYGDKMAAYNNMCEEEKEEIRRVNRAENYALLERMRALANRHYTFQGPAPVNLLEKQFMLITHGCACAGGGACGGAGGGAGAALGPHNAHKNRPRGALPADAARVLLLPKPGVEGSEYVNASWVCGRRRLREYAVAQHPPPAPAAPAAPADLPDQAQLWRLLWDHTAQLVLVLSDTTDPECKVFWPTEEEKELFVANFRASFVSKDTLVARRKEERRGERGAEREGERGVSADSPPPPNGEAEGGGRRDPGDCADDERLIPERGSPLSDAEPAYRFDRADLRLERLSGHRDLSARKSIANGDLFSSISEKKNGPKSPRSPSKMSLKNFKLSSPTKFKFPDWGTNRTAGSPPDTAPPPPPVAPALSVEEEAELRRPCYYFEKVDSVPEGVPTDRVIEVTNVSVHSLQDDYQLSVKFIQCSGWLEGDTTRYTTGRPEDNEYIRAVRRASSDCEREQALDRLVQPYEDSFALLEFVAGCQMEYKNGPVVVVDKYGGWKAMTFCSLSAASGGARAADANDPFRPFRPPADDTADLYCWSALAAHSRILAPIPPSSPCASPSSSPGSPAVPPRPTEAIPHTPSALLAAYCALASYGPRLHAPSIR